MGISLGEQEDGRARPRSAPLSTVGAYLLLFILGAAQGLVGSFQYSRTPTPLIAILLILVIFATCLLSGMGMRSYGGGIMPAIGWILASFILAMPKSNGSVIITASAAGQWYLYGGALAASLGAITSFYLWARTRISSESPAA